MEEVGQSTEALGIISKFDEWIGEMKLVKCCRFFCGQVVVVIPEWMVEQESRPVLAT